jgi:hypothetical protein
MGLAAGLVGVQPAFLRSLDAAGLLTPRTLRRRPTPLQPRRTPLAQSAHYSIKTCHSRLTEPLAVVIRIQHIGD